MSTDISVVIPIYNKGEVLGQTLESVAAQRTKPDSVILIDDGSADESRSIAESYRDRFAGFVLERQAHAGVSAARNRGVARSVTTWIAFLDADDLWRPRHVEALMQARRQFPQAGLIATKFCEFERIPPACEATSDAIESQPVDYFRMVAAGKPPVWTSSTMIRRSIFDRIGGFPVGVNRGEDLIVWARSALVSEVIVSSYLGALYRRGPDGLSRGVMENPDMAMQTYLAIADDPATPHHRADQAREAMARLALAHATDALISGRPDIARRFLPFSAKSRLHWRLHMCIATLSRLPARASQRILQSIRRRRY